ncbi:MAG: undecaprenyl-diphosphatase [Isosphaeraceae bacterium]|jgi:undecaprenyl-diphosphatase|nr:MAG: undecaprenyl-diphosphatase [Isosphaeraceae bacterium]
MGEWIRVLFLGLVQGLTEFLPISSDGHLALFQILTNGWLGLEQTGSEHIFFDVMLHLGTTAAIVWSCRNQVRAGVLGLLGKEGVAEGYRRPALIRLGVLTIVAMLPLLPVVLFRKQIAELFESLTAVGWGFLVTAVVLLVTSRLRGGEKGPREMNWLDALLIGAAQALAPLPGVSRSGMTVAMALARGFTKTWAVGFSLMLAVPTILCAAAYELKGAQWSALTPLRIGQIVAATVVAGAVGYVAILWLVRAVRSGKLWYFSVYLIALGTVILAILAPRAQGGP